jgi:hypothetical protein
MSATIEKAKGAIRRSRLPLLDDALESRRQKLAAAEAEIADLQSGQQAVIAEALQADLNRSAFQRGGPAAERERKAAELEKSAGHLRAEIVALEDQRVSVASEEAARKLEGHTKTARGLLAEERAARIAAGEAFARLAETWNALAAVLERRDALRSQVAGEKLADVADPDTASRWETVAGFVVEPVPTTFVVFVDELLDAAFAERVEVEGEYAAIDEINRRRREMAARNPGGGDDLPPVPKPIIREEPLQALVPDLRGEVREAEIGGVEVRRGRRVEPEPWPGAA